MGQIKNFAQTLSWTGTDPSPITKSFEYFFENGVMFFIMDVSATDGNDASALTGDLPFSPSEMELLVPCAGGQKVGSSWTNAIPYVDCQGTARTIAFKALGTCTDGSALVVRVTGIVPVGPSGVVGSSVDMAGNWRTGTAAITPDSLTEYGYSAIMDEVALNWHSSISTDPAEGTDSDADTWDILPQPAPPDLDTYLPFEIMHLDDSTWSDPLGTADAAHGTATSRLAHCIGTISPTDDTDAEMCAFMATPAAVWNSWTPTLTYTTGTPSGSLTTKGHYSVYEGKNADVCFFNIYTSATDGNSATALTITNLPQPVRYGLGRISLSAVQLVDTTYSDPAAYIDARQFDADDRFKISFDNFSTCTDAAAAKLFVSGWYPIASR